MARIEFGERFDRVLGYINDNGPFQMSRERFAETVGVPPRSLTTYIKKMEELHLIRVDRPRGYNVAGGGAENNIYWPVVTVAAWDERRRALVIEERRKQAARTRAQHAARKSAAATAAENARQLEELKIINDALLTPDPIIMDIERSIAKEVGMNDVDLVDAWLGGL